MVQADRGHRSGWQHPTHRSGQRAEQQSRQAAAATHCGVVTEVINSCSMLKLQLWGRWLARRECEFGDAQKAGRSCPHHHRPPAPQTYLALAIAPGTRRTYATGVNSYIAFITTHGIPTAFPASVETLCLWMSWLASRSLTFGTCKVYLAAVVNRHAEMGLTHPLADAPPILDRVLAGIKRAAASTARPKLPITTTMLRSMLPHLHLQHRRDALVWAMMWTATAGLLRISEFALTSSDDSDRTLRMQHLTLFDDRDRPYSAQQLRSSQSPRYAILHLDASKADPFRLGVDIVISAPLALSALRTYLSVCGATRRTPTTPLFHFEDGAAVTRRWLMSRVDGLLRCIHLNPSTYSSHSFRKGGAVSLQQQGVEDSIIRRAGRWRSDAFNLYVRHASMDSLVAANARL